MLWFILGLIVGMVIGLRDKILENEKIIDKIVNGKAIQIGENFYKTSKMDIK